MSATSTARRFIDRCAYLYTSAVLLLFFSVADQALGHARLLPLSPTLLCLILLSPYCFKILIDHCMYASKPGPLTLLSRQVCTLAPLGAVALVAIALSILPDTYWQESGKWVFLIPYGFSIVCASTLLGSCAFIRGVLPLVTLTSNLLLAWSVWYDTLHPGTFAPITNRAAGFPGNANFAALVSVMVCAAGLQFGSSLSSTPFSKSQLQGSDNRISLAPILNLLLLVVTFATVCMTMSRSGLVNFLLLCGVFFFFRLVRSSLPSLQRIREIALLCTVAVIAIGFTIMFTTITSSNSNTRLTRLLNRQQVDDGSAGTRLQAAKDAINLIESAPLLGHGTGYARTMSELPHNIYLQQWVNNGLPGVLSYMAFLFGGFITFLHRGSRNGVALILVATVGGLFSHNILDQRPFLLLIGILLGLSQGDRQVQGTEWLPIPRHTSATLPHEPHLALASRATLQ